MEERKDLISRDFIKSLGGECIAARDSKTHELLPISSIDALPSAQPEPSIPISWINEQIEWLKGLDNGFSTITAMQISTMVNKWNREGGQNE